MKVKQTWFIDGEVVSQSYIKILAVKLGACSVYNQYNFANIPFNVCTKFLMSYGINLDVKTELIDE